MADDPQPKEDFNENPEEAWVTDDSWVDDLNPQWRQVIDGLMNRKNMTEAYGLAYDMNIEDAKQKNVAAACGSRLLRNANFRKLWRKVIEEKGFNDETADNVLRDLMTNPGTPQKAQVDALKLYYAIQGRITKKTDITSGGEKIAPLVLSDVEPRNAVSETQTETGS